MVKFVFSHSRKAWIAGHRIKLPGHQLAGRAFYDDSPATAARVIAKGIVEQNSIGNE